MSIAEKLTTIAENEQKVYDAGKQAEYDAFWDAYQDYGKRTDSRYFCSYYNFTPETFKPKYPIYPSSYMFDQCTMEISLIEKGVKFNPTPNASVSLGYAFRGSDITEIPTIDVSKGNPLSYAFYNMPNLTKIEKLIVGENTQFSNTFGLSKNLTEIRFEGVIAYNNFNVSACVALSHDSLISIINALKDYSTDTSGTTYTVILGSVNIAKLSEDELKQIDDKGWMVN